MGDVQAAAERVRRVHGGELLNSVYHDPQYPEATNYHLGYKGDTQEIVQAYLAEHPADDAEPITEEWLLAVGLVESQNSLRFQKWFVIPNCDGWSRAVQGPACVEARACEGPKCWQLSLWNWTERIKDSPSRGDLRRLCAALNIPLKQ